MINTAAHTLESMRQSSMAAHTDVAIQIHKGYKKAHVMLVEEIGRLRALCEKHDIDHTNPPPNRAARRDTQKKQAKTSKAKTRGDTSLGM